VVARQPAQAEKRCRCGNARTAAVPERPQP
jgi:hypothetical protein